MHFGRGTASGPKPPTPVADVPSEGTYDVWSLNDAGDDAELVERCVDSTHADRAMRRTDGHAAIARRGVMLRPKASTSAKAMGILRRAIEAAERARVAAPEAPAPVEESAAPVPPCEAKGCEHLRAGVRADTKPACVPFCRDHRQLIKDRVRDRGVTAEIVADALREGRDVPALAPGARAATSRTAPTAARVVERAPVVDQEFEVNEPLDLVHTVEMSADALRPVSGDTIERGTLVMIDEAPAAVEPEPIAPPCSAGTFNGGTIGRGFDGGTPATASPAPVEPLTFNELADAAATVLDALPSDVGLFFGRSVVEVLVDDKVKAAIRHDGSADPMRLLATALAEKASDLVERRRVAMDSAELALTMARHRHADAVALVSWLRSVGA